MIATVAVSACPLCGGEEREVVYADARDLRFGVPGSWSFVRCRACGVVYQTPRPSNPADGYPTAYPQHQVPVAPHLDCSPPRAGVKNLLRRSLLAAHGYTRLASAPLRWVGQLLKWIAPLRYHAFSTFLHLPNGRRVGRLLDVGCGNGRLLCFARQLGWEVAGIEPDAASARIAREIAGAQVYPTLEEAQFADASFDAITMNHSLEHVVDPRAVLRACRRLLRPGGELVIALPNWNAAGRLLLGARWFALEPARHLVMFDARRLRSFLEEEGFQVEELATTSVRERPQGALARILELAPAMGGELVARATKSSGAPATPSTAAPPRGAAATQ